ncbi:hypothetical protein ARMGADRAFT_1036573 [Armillaria gallica]|uniref:Uncharacterized protein n=1 Tax=Armillaria gallica TaxID=47427 RepID=A0A2H3CPP2_ARMGA|nr:hypothetical protein ARMGADRAFT_1036573 [Armillaria gallica]
MQRGLRMTGKDDDAPITQGPRLSVRGEAGPRSVFSAHPSAHHPFLPRLQLKTGGVLGYLWSAWKPPSVEGDAGLDNGVFSLPSVERTLLFFFGGGGKSDPQRQAWFPVGTIPTGDYTWPGHKREEAPPCTVTSPNPANTMNVVRITVYIDSDTRSTSNLNTQMGACDSILWKKSSNWETMKRTNMKQTWCWLGFPLRHMLLDIDHYELRMEVTSIRGHQGEDRGHIQEAQYDAESCFSHLSPPPKVSRRRIIRPEQTPRVVRVEVSPFIGMYKFRTGWKDPNSGVMVAEWALARLGDYAGLE